MEQFAEQSIQKDFRLLESTVERLKFTRDTLRGILQGMADIYSSMLELEDDEDFSRQLALLHSRGDNLLVDALQLCTLFDVTVTDPEMTQVQQIIEQHMKETCDSVAELRVQLGGIASDRSNIAELASQDFAIHEALIEELKKFGTTLQGTIISTVKTAAQFLLPRTEFAWNKATWVANKDRAVDLLKNAQVTIDTAETLMDMLAKHDLGDSVILKFRNQLTFDVVNSLVRIEYQGQILDDKLKPVQAALPDEDEQLTQEQYNSIFNVVDPITVKLMDEVPVLEKFTEAVNLHTPDKQRFERGIAQQRELQEERKTEARLAGEAPEEGEDQDMLPQEVRDAVKDMQQLVEGMQRTNKEEFADLIQAVEDEEGEGVSAPQKQQQQQPLSRLQQQQQQQQPVLQQPPLAPQQQPQPQPQPRPEIAVDIEMGEREEEEKQIAEELAEQQDAVDNEMLDLTGENQAEQLAHNKIMDGIAREDLQVHAKLLETEHKLRVGDADALLRQQAQQHKQSSEAMAAQAAQRNQQIQDNFKQQELQLKQTERAQNNELKRLERQDRVAAEEARRLEQSHTQRTEEQLKWEKNQNELRRIKIDEAKANLEKVKAQREIALQNRKLDGQMRLDIAKQEQVHAQQKAELAQKLAQDSKASQLAEDELAMKKKKQEFEEQARTKQLEHDATQQELKTEIERDKIRLERAKQDAKDKLADRDLRIKESEQKAVEFSANQKLELERQKQEIARDKEKLELEFEREKNQAAQQRDRDKQSLEEKKLSNEKARREAEAQEIAAKRIKEQELEESKLGIEERKIVAQQLQAAEELGLKREVFREETAQTREKQEREQQAALQRARNTALSVKADLDSIKKNAKQRAQVINDDVNRVTLDKVNETQQWTSQQFRDVTQAMATVRSEAPLPVEEHIKVTDKQKSAALALGALQESVKSVDKVLRESGVSTINIGQQRARNNMLDFLQQLERMQSNIDVVISNALQLERETIGAKEVFFGLDPFVLRQQIESKLELADRLKASGERISNESSERLQAVREQFDRIPRELITPDNVALKDAVEQELKELSKKLSEDLQQTLLNLDTTKDDIRAGAAEQRVKHVKEDISVQVPQEEAARLIAQARDQLDKVRGQLNLGDTSSLAELLDNDLFRELRELEIPGQDSSDPELRAEALRLEQKRKLLQRQFDAFSKQVGKSTTEQISTSLRSLFAIDRGSRKQSATNIADRIMLHDHSKVSLSQLAQLAQQARLVSDILRRDEGVREDDPIIKDINVWVRLADLRLQQAEGQARVVSKGADVTAADVLEQLRKTSATVPPVPPVLQPPVQPPVAGAFAPSSIAAALPLQPSRGAFAPPSLPQQQQKQRPQLFGQRIEDGGATAVRQQAATQFGEGRTSTFTREREKARDREKRRRRSTFFGKIADSVAGDRLRKTPEEAQQQALPIQSAPLAKNIPAGKFSRGGVLGALRHVKTQVPVGKLYAAFVRDSARKLVLADAQRQAIDASSRASGSVLPTVTAQINRGIADQQQAQLPQQQQQQVLHQQQPQLQQQVRGTGVVQAQA